MSNHLMENFNVESMEENSLAKKIVSLNLTVKTNIGLEMGGQTTSVS